MFNEIVRGLDWSFLGDILISIIPALLCITLHELAHGYVAYKLGDNTAKNAGRLTLNPIKHIDMMGLAMMVVFRFGWAKPVPVNIRNFKNKKRGMALTAAAGPITNVLITVVFLFLYGATLTVLTGMGDIGILLSDIFLITAQLSLYFAVFNMLPVPPLDGSKVVSTLLPDKAYIKYMSIERYGMLILVFLLFALNSSGSNILGMLTFGLFEGMFPIAQFGFDLVNG